MTLSQKPLPPCSSAAEYLWLFEDCFPETVGTPLLTAEHYNWKYGPAGKVAPAFEYGAYDEERMIGYYAALPFHYRASSETVVGGMVCDVMTHSSMRGKGIFTKQGAYATTAMAEAGVGFVLGFPIRSYVFPGHLKVGWRIAFELPVYFRLLDPGPPLATRKVGWLGPVLRPLCDLYRALLRLGRGDSGDCERLPVESFFRSPEYLQFYDRWAEHVPFHLVRTSDFFCWRLAAPKTSYTVTVLRQGKELGALAVTRITRLQGFDVLAVVDLMVLPQFQGAVGRLHEEIARQARECGAAGVVIMVPRPEARLLRLTRNGFFKSSVVFKLILKWLAQTPPPDSFWEAGSWHLAWIDTDNL